jgi:hypothetical protein
VLQQLAGHDGVVQWSLRAVYSSRTVTLHNSPDGAGLHKNHQTECPHQDG